jgi:nucleoside-diphosphate-sugar epimerase
MSKYLVTGAAGFIGSRVAALLLDAGHQVVGIDVLNDAYDVRLKQWRLDRLADRDGFTFQRIDICDRPALEARFAADATTAKNGPPYDAVLNLAARAGVRPSVENPWVYIDANATGTLNLLDLCRCLRRPASTAPTTLCRTAKTPTPAVRSRRMPRRRRPPRRCAIRIITCTAST